MASHRSRTHYLAYIVRLIWLVVYVIILLLAIRFCFVLFGVKQGSGFVNFIYNASYPFAKPFFGVFGYNIHYGIKRVEPSSIIAIAVYAIAGYLLVRLLTINKGND